MNITSPPLGNSPTMFDTPIDIDIMPTKRPSEDSAGPSTLKKRPQPPNSGFKVVEMPELPDHFELPPLPPIKNRAIEKRAFTHPSVHGNVRKGVKFVEDEEVDDDNEKLEWVGDGLLKATCTRLLNRLWPRLAEGPSTVGPIDLQPAIRSYEQLTDKKTILSALVSNTTLAYLSRRYDLMKRLRMASSARMSIATSERNHANLFEAYIAAVFQSSLHPDPEADVHTNGSKGADHAVGTIKEEVPDFNLAATKTVHSGKTEGQAYDELSAWLVPLLTPIAFFIRDHLQSERHRISQQGHTEIGQGDSHIDPTAVIGSTARLNEHFTRILKKPLPKFEFTETEGLLWRTKCIASLDDGEQITAETVQTNKKSGMQVAAHKVLLQMGLVEPSDT